MKLARKGKWQGRSSGECTVYANCNVWERIAEAKGGMPLVLTKEKGYLKIR